MAVIIKQVVNKIAQNAGPERASHTPPSRRQTHRHTDTQAHRHTDTQTRDWNSNPAGLEGFAAVPGPLPSHGGPMGFFGVPKLNLATLALVYKSYSATPRTPLSS